MGEEEVESNTDNSELFDVKKQTRFLIHQGWTYTGKFPHLWGDPTLRYDEDNTVSLVEAVEIARSRLRMLRETASEEALPATAIFAALNQVAEEYVEAGCDSSSGEFAAIDRLRKTFKQELGKKKRKRRRS